MILRRALFQFLQIFFRLLYQPLAWTYDFVAAVVSSGHWQDWVQSVLPYLDEEASLLELGFGPGHLQATLSGRGQPIFGVDASPQMAAITRRRLQQAQLPRRIALGYAQQLPFKGDSFHQVVATFPPEFIIDESMYHEVYRVLQPGGEFIVLPHAWITGGRKFERAAAWLFRITGQSPPWKDQLRKYFLRAGFEAHSEKIIQQNWEVVIIRARKPAAVPAERHR